MDQTNFTFTSANMTIGVLVSTFVTFVRGVSDKHDLPALFDGRFFDVTSSIKLRLSTPTVTFTFHLPTCINYQTTAW